MCAHVSWRSRMSTGLFDRQPSKPQARPLLQFKAGKMTMNPDNSVHADARKGCAYLYQTPGDYSVHFCWFDRRTGLIEENFVLVPREAEFKPVPQCKSGRVFVLKLSAPQRRFFLWMQEPNASNDAQICETVNKFINTPPAPIGSSVAGSLVSSRSAGRMADFFSGMRGLSGMNQNDLLTLFSMGMGFGMPSDGESSAQALPVPTGRLPFSSRVEAPAMHTASSSSVPAIPASNSAPAAAGSSSSTADSQPGKLRLQDLHSILSTIQSTATSDQSGRGVDMTQGLSVDTLIEVMDKKPALAERLAAHLPSIDPEDQQLTPSQAVIANVRSPQFKYALKSFSEALESGQLGSALSQFGLDEEVIKSADTGDLEVFASALQRSLGAEKKQPESSSTSTGETLKKPEDDDEDNRKDDDGGEKMDTT
eukprot:TsM_001031500 transcript=TsM_001031500 gene=TsM_001031500